MVNFEWDEPKATTNRRKHGVSFEEAETVFGNVFAVTNDVVHSHGDDRERTIGMSDISAY